MSEALKPCPFCGADIAQLREGSDLMWVYGLECRAEGPPSLKTGGNSSAIAAWNRRAPSVTREEIAARLLAHDEESTEDWAVNYIKMGMNDADHSIMEEVANEYLARADAILALFGGE